VFEQGAAGPKHEESGVQIVVRGRRDGVIVEAERFCVGGEDVLSGQGRLVGVELGGVLGCVLHGRSRVFEDAVECACDERVCIEKTDLAVGCQAEEV